MTASYFVPANRHRVELAVSNSRFIVICSRVSSVDDTKALLDDVRKEMPDASHHVYAFRVGYGNNVIEGMSDAGEPSGTAGPPVLAVLRGAAIGDIMIVVTRYFGGTKLGTGGLVRAYTEAAKLVLSTLSTEEKILKCTLGFEVPYPLYTQTKRLLSQYKATLIDEVFAGDVTILVSVPVTEVDTLTRALTDLSSGTVIPVLLDSP